MMFSTKAEYGVRVMAHLAKANGDGPISLGVIADVEGLPLAYLEHLVQRLRRAELVESHRGAHGGYQLAKSPEEITVFDALTALEGSLDPMTCLSTTLDAGEGPSCLASGSCAVQEVWGEMPVRLQASLRRDVPVLAFL